MQEKSSFPAGSAGIGRELGKILVIAEDPWARDTIRVLLSSMGCHCVMATSVPQELATLGQERPGAVIVDAQALASATAAALSGIDEICLNPRGPIIVLTSEGQNPEVADLIERYDLVPISRERLLQDLWGTLNPLLRPISVTRRIVQAARLIFDSFLEPAPVGIRISQLHGRRFVYQADSLMIDLSLEPPLTGSHRFSLVGQLMDSTKPEPDLEVLSVRLQGPKGPIALTSTNKFGEFRFEFSLEQNVKLEIETVAQNWISIVLPSLEWAEKRAAAFT
jgi:CheY-like chemotaxis protein